MEDTSKLTAQVAMLQEAMRVLQQRVALMQNTQMANTRQPGDAKNISGLGKHSKGVDSGNGFKPVLRGTVDYPNEFGVRQGSVFVGDTELTENPVFGYWVPTASFAVTADTYGWVDIDTAASTWSMNTGAAIPAAAAGHVVWPLWELVWDAVSSKVGSCDLYWSGDIHYGGDGGEAENPGAEVETWDNDLSETLDTDLNVEDYTGGTRDVTWTAGNVDGHGLVINIPVKVIYYEDGDEILYLMWRKFTFDQYGRLYSVGPMFRNVVDIPVVV